MERFFEKYTRVRFTCQNRLITIKEKEIKENKEKK